MPGLLQSRQLPGFRAPVHHREQRLRVPGRVRRRGRLHRLHLRLLQQHLHADLRLPHRRLLRDLRQRAESLLHNHTATEHDGHATRYIKLQGDMGGLTPDLGSSPGWPASTAGTDCLKGGWNIRNLSPPNPGVRPPESPCK